MTLISFFDEDPVDNIADILYLQPAHCVFLGDDMVMKKRKRALIEQFVQARGLAVQVEFHSLPRGDIEGTLDLMRRLITSYPDSILDVSGGTELLLCAAGIISGTYGIPLYQRNGRSSKILWQYGCALGPKPAAVSVPEVIALHSGAVIQDGQFLKPNLTEALCRQIPRLWDIAREDPAQWNSTCISLGSLSEKSEAQDPLEVALSGQQKAAAFCRADRSILAALAAEGFLLDLDDTWGGISFRFRDADIQMILTKAGMLLELCTYMAAPWADDRAVSICLDWDGLDPDGPGIQTRNELDVMLTCGMMPVCISCKNGMVSKEALYELETVGRHFGGRYARKVLVASYVDKNERAVQTLERRARDMNIIPIFRVHELPFEAFASRLEKELLTSGRV